MTSKVLKFPKKQDGDKQDLAVLAAGEGLKVGAAMLLMRWSARRKYRAEQLEIMRAVALDYLAKGDLTPAGFDAVLNAYNTAINARLDDPNAVFEIGTDG